MLQSNPTADQAGLIPISPNSAPEVVQANYTTPEVVPNHQAPEVAQEKAPETYTHPDDWRNDKYALSENTDNIAAEVHPDEKQDDNSRDIKDGRAARMCGMRRMPFFALLLALLVLVIIAAVLGGVLGTRAQERHGTQSYGLVNFSPSRTRSLMPM